MNLVVESENTLKQKYDEMERKLQEKEKELEGRITAPVDQSSEHTIVQAMSQVSLKYLELTWLKNQNKTLENIGLKREQEKKTWEAKSQAWEAKCQEMQTNNDKLMKRVTGQLQVQGDKHIIWDSIIEEAKKFRPYLDYILDKELVIHSSI